MSTNPIHPQRGPAAALVQLLTEYPDLPEATWRVDPSSGVLSGHMHGPFVADFDGLTRYAEVLGGGIRPTYTYDVGQTTFRVHELRAVWRDVTVVVSVGIAELAPAVAA